MKQRTRRLLLASVISIFILGGCDAISTTSQSQSSSTSSPSSSGSASKKAKWSCWDYGVEEVLTYERSYGEWPYGSGGLPSPPSSMKSCFKRNWTFENCARQWGLGGNMSACQDKVQEACCPGSKPRSSGF